MTEIFAPYFHFGGKPLHIQASAGECEYVEDKQSIYHYYDGQEEAPISITLSVLNHTPPKSYSCNLM